MSVGLVIGLVVALLATGIGGYVYMNQCPLSGLKPKMTSPGSGYCGAAGWISNRASNAGNAVGVDTPAACAKVCDGRPTCNGYAFYKKTCYPKAFKSGSFVMKNKSATPGWSLAMKTGPGKS
jgi:hypothetical protein